MWCSAMEKLRPDVKKGEDLFDENGKIIVIRTQSVVDFLEAGVYKLYQNERDKLEAQFEISKKRKTKNLKDIEEDFAKEQVELDIIYQLLFGALKNLHIKAEKENKELYDLFSSEHASRGGYQM